MNDEETIKELARITGELAVDITSIYDILKDMGTADLEVIEARQENIFDLLVKLKEIREGRL